MLKIKRILSLIWAIRPGGTMFKRGSDILKSHGIKLKVNGNIPNYQCIMVANHLGYLDAVALASIVKCRPIARSELSKWPGIGKALSRLGIIFYSRGDVISGFKTLRNSIKVLKSGENILVFPEGTTTNGFQVLPFKRGIFGVSKLTGVPIVPIKVTLSDRKACWTDDTPFLDHYWEQLGRESTTLEITFLDPIYPGKHSKPSKLAELARKLIRTAW